MKKIFTILLIFSGLLFYSQTFCQDNSEYAKAKKYLDKKGEVYFHFTVQNPSSLLDLTNIISIDNVKDGEVWAYANKKEFAKFLERNIPYEVLFHPGDVEVEMWDQSKGIWQFDTYPNYTEYETMMQTFATDHPNICTLETIATLASGRKLLAIKISDNPNANEDEPEFLYSAAMHGNETTGYVLFLRLIDYLTNNYGTNTRATNIVNNMEIWICPLANPDGTYAGGNASVTGATRENSSNVDLNRNYPDPRAGQHPDGNSWQPETVAWMNFADAHDFVMAANTHGGAEVANYPWDTWTSAQKTHADDNWWQYVCNEYVDSAQLNGPAGYFTSVVSSGVTEGGDWFVITGGRQDYMTYYKHCRELTLEISDSYVTTASLLPNYWNYNYRSFLNYLEQSLYGVRGIITDVCTGLPIKAKVFVNSHDVDSSHVYSSLPIGNYHRPILAGTYSITYSATGYQPQTITGVTVANKATVIRNIQLTQIAPTANFAADHTTGCIATVQFTDISGAPSGTTFLWNFGDGQTSTLQNPSHTYSASGNYTVTLTITSCAGNDVEVKADYISISLPTAPATVSDDRCGAGTVSLSATGNGTLNWYDAPSGGNLVNTGTTYSPSITTNTTYYVESSTTSFGASQFGGKTDNSGTGVNHTSANYGLYFDVLQNMKLISIKVYSSQLGNRTIVITDSNGTEVFNQSISIPNGESRITLNANLTPGTDYSILCTTTPNLYRNGGNGSPTLPYPFLTPGVFSITGNPASNNAYYYYFYDWEVQTQTTCTSAKTPVIATINPFPTANAGNDQSITNGTTTTLNGSASNGIGPYLYHWEPATQLVNANNQNPTTLSLTSTTTFILTVTDQSTGCTGIDTVIVNVSLVGVSNLETDLASVLVYPNPSNGFITVQSLEFAEISIHDITGRIVFASKIEKKINPINISNLSDGLYYLQYLSDKGKKNIPIVIAH